MRHPLAIALLAISAGLIPGAALAQWYQGPSGGPGGQAFDDWQTNGHASNIRRVQIYTYKSNNRIQCIRTFYPNPAAPDDPAQSHSAAPPSPQCGAVSSATLGPIFKLDPDEYILGIAGQYTDHITQLRFFTNKKNSPVYGEGGGRAFGYTAPRGQMIVAFIGAGDWGLRSIGVMYAPCTPATKICK